MFRDMAKSSQDISNVLREDNQDIRLARPGVEPKTQTTTGTDCGTNTAHSHWESSGMDGKDSGNLREDESLQEENLALKLEVGTRPSLPRTRPSLPRIYRMSFGKTIKIPDEISRGPGVEPKTQTTTGTGCGTSTAHSHWEPSGMDGKGSGNPRKGQGSGNLREDGPLQEENLALRRRSRIWKEALGLLVAPGRFPGSPLPPFLALTVGGVSVCLRYSGAGAGSVCLSICGLLAAGNVSVCLSVCGLMVGPLGLDRIWVGAENTSPRTLLRSMLDGTLLRSMLEDLELLQKRHRRQQRCSLA